MSLRHAILGILEYQPMHGYSLKRVLAEGISTFWPVNLPAIYPSLRKLEQEGLVAHRMETTRDGRPDRKVFTITPTGRAELERWRRLPPDGPMTVRSPLYLKLLFAKPDDYRDVLDWLDKAIDEGRTLLSQLRADQTNPNAFSSFFVRYMRESGISHSEIQIELMQDLRARVAAHAAERDAQQGRADLHAEVSGSENEPTRHQ
ncbi:MAG TPA: PadR family transcriptional regulator [Myxococcota bacterium]|jgi:DNA-binding PadR family transcriptional regulator|nr:PadR family transcriptional regulator [Myxococcota bacterium]